jgi:hypothetical protein
MQKLQAAEKVSIDQLGVLTRAKAQSLQDKTFSAGLKTRSPGVKSGAGTFFPQPV